MIYVYCFLIRHTFSQQSALFNNVAILLKKNDADNYFSQFFNDPDNICLSFIFSKKKYVYLRRYSENNSVGRA